MKTKIGIYSFFLSIALFALAIFSPLKAVDTASLLPMPVQQFFDNNGNPLTSGYVYTYEVGTSTFKTTWKDSAEAVPNTNPIRLDAGGKAIIYGSGNYRQLVKDRNGNQIWDAVTAPGGGGSSPTSVGDGNLVGTVLPWSGLVAPNQYVFAYGQEISRSGFPEYYTAATQQLNVICSAASNILTGISDTSQVRIGSPVELALCVPVGTTVVSKTVATITLSNASSVSINSVATFFPWGNGNGSTTFNVPDFRGYVLAGRDNMGGTPAAVISQNSISFGTNSPDALGATGGAQNRTLTTANIPELTVTGSGGNIYSNNPAVVTNVIGGGGAQIGADNTIRANRGVTAGAFSIIQPTITINYIVKVTPDTSTSIATGVYSIGGMTGVISCDSASILCTGNIISAVGTVPGGVTTNVQFNNANVFGGVDSFSFISPDTLTLGAVGITGKFDIYGLSSGHVRQTVQAAAGTPTVTWGTSSGTPAVTVSSPLSLSTATGNLTLPGLAGGVLAGATPAFTTTPVLGASGTLGTLGFGNATSGTITLSPVAGALGTVTLTMPAATDTLAVLAASQALTNKTYNGLTLTSTTGTFTLTNGKTFAVTHGLTLAGTDSTTMTFPSVSATITRTVASGAKALATGAIGSAACTAAQTDTATGTLTTDTIAATFNADPTAVTGYVPLTTGMLTIIPYPTADTVNFKVCNNSGSSITPGAITLNWRVTR